MEGEQEEECEGKGDEEEEKEEEEEEEDEEEEDFTYIASSFHSYVFSSLFFTTANANMMWVQSLGSILSGVYFPIPGRYWDQLV